MVELNIKTDVKVADDTISMIAGMAATSVPGVLALGEGVTFKALPFIGSNSLKKGVVIEKDDSGKNIIARLTIVLEQGKDIRKTCTNIQEKVKEAIESMLDLNVKEVSVRVAKVNDV
jgi:uncharacterized alkaline shock family protein YloU